MDTKYPFLQVVSASLPNELSKELAALCSAPSSEALLDNLIRFVCGAECSSGDEDQWAYQQAVVQRKLGGLLSSSSKKRARESDVAPESSTSKRQKTFTNVDSVSDDPPKFTLHSISVSSPVRKKVDVAIHESSIRFINPNPKPDASAIEAVIPLSSLRRAFLVPTRGKPKPHWTVLILSNDVPEKGKAPSKTSNDSANTGGVNPQIIFGLDAAATAGITSTLYAEEQDEANTLKKGEETLPLLQQFLSHLSLPNPSLHLSIEKIENFGKFKGAAANSGVKEYPTLAVSANLAAKAGTLWFMPEGILWGESKPCQFWSHGDLLPSGTPGGEGVRTMTATGRVCTVVLTRRNEDDVGAPVGVEDEQDLIGEETVFGQIDGKEQEAINQWVRKYRNAFGVKGGSDVNANGTSGASTSKMKTSAAATAGGSGQPTQPPPSPVNAGPLTINQMLVDSEDEEDADFAPGGGGGSGSDSSSDGELSGGDGSGDDDDDGDGDEVDGSGEEDGSADEDEGEQELKPQHHPLLRPGTMPKMSRAAMDMVVDMVEGDLVGPAAGHGEGEGEEEDELED
ncbi:hypothetical protein GYMLUDRAFT_94509 [Collybiopsis luxurians FD-317 M1]|nr:hypothetical protein GYMLUDRAFT_94509 [Collybiopsis luxurians FD-317 M1]